MIISIHREYCLAIIFLLVYVFSVSIIADNFFQKGHVKYQSLLIDNQPPEHNIESRLNFSIRHSNWVLQTDYQLLRSKTITDDQNRLFDLTARLHEGNPYTITHRLDRLHLTHTSEQTVFRLGRQAISWGNGLVYNPMDFFNPFDPTSIDKEYKTGDDMLYGQYLFDSGDDFQAVWVERRDDDGDRTGEVSSVAAKYHLFLEDYEFDFLLSRHFDQQVLGLGGVANVGGAVWRGDIVSTEADKNRRNSTVLNVSYSWVAFDKNMSGHVELFRSAFGISNADYSPANLIQKPELITRISRGELFTLGKHYLNASATIELTPLWLFTTTLFTNLDDHSKFVQLLSRHDLQQNLQLLIAANIPSGDRASEFALTDESLFAQLGFYF